MGHTLQGQALRRRKRCLGGVLSVGALLTLGLAGCGNSVSVAGAAPTAPRATAYPTLTSAATATPTTAATATPAITPAPSAGWATYRDRRFPFQVPLPPGWQPASLTWPPQSDPSGFNYYIVQFFPPGPHGEPGPGATAMAPELIAIDITLSGPSTSLPPGTGLSPEPGTVALGNQQVLLYDAGTPGYDIGRGVMTTIGTYPMNLSMHYLAYGRFDTAIAQRDIALFLAMLKGYRPV